MPSPVIGSTTRAASPANSTRPRCKPAASSRWGSARRAPSLRARRAARARPHARSVEHVAPQLFEVTAAAVRVAQHAVADVGAAAGKREHPRVTGQEVALEQHPQTPVAGVGEVLAGRVPRCRDRRCAARRGGESATNDRRPRPRSGRVHATAVGRASRRRRRRRARCDRGHAARHRLRSLGAPRRAACAATAASSRMRVMTAAKSPRRRECQRDLAAVGDDEHCVVDRGTRRRRRAHDVDAEVLEPAQRTGRESVAARLVAWERRLVGHRARARAGGPRSRRRIRPVRHRHDHVESLRRQARPPDAR